METRWYSNMQVVSFVALYIILFALLQSIGPVKVILVLTKVTGHNGRDWPSEWTFKCDSGGFWRVLSTKSLKIYQNTNGSKIQIKLTMLCLQLTLILCHPFAEILSILDNNQTNWQKCNLSSVQVCLRSTAVMKKFIILLKCLVPM